MKSPPPQISILLQTKFVPVFLDLQKKNYGFYWQEARVVSFQHNLKTFLKSSSSTWSAWNQMIVVISDKLTVIFLSWQTSEQSRPASYGNFRKFWLLRFARLSKKCQNCATLLNWIFNYSFIRVICYLSAKFSFTFIFLSRRAEASREIQTFGGEILFLSEISIIACISRFLRYKTVQHSEIVYYQ